MPSKTAVSTLSLFVVLLGLAPYAAAQAKEFRYSVGPQATIGITNPFGSVTLRSSPDGEVIVRAKPASDQVEIQPSQTGNRIEISSHATPRVAQQNASVDYTVQLPTQATVTVRSSTGSISAEGLQGDLTLESDAGAIDVRHYSASHLMVRTIGSPITLSDIPNGHVELSTVSGKVLLSNVSASRVAVNTTGGNVQYDGGFAVAGEYAIITYSGNIEVNMPPKASVEITAQSVKGRVEDEFHFHPQENPKINFSQGKWFAGTANTGNRGAGAASVRLRSFSGTIRVTRQ